MWLCLRGQQGRHLGVLVEGLSLSLYTQKCFAPLEGTRVKVTLADALVGVDAQLYSLRQGGQNSEVRSFSGHPKPFHQQLPQM